MRRSLTLLYLLLIAILFSKQVRAPLPHPDVTEPDPVPEPEPEPEPEPVSNPSGSESNSGDDGYGSIGDIPPEPIAPATPVAPPAKGNEAEFEEEDVDYSEILEHVSDLLDAITSIISAVDDGSSTTVSAPLPSAALPCYSVSSIYNDCGLHSSIFPNVIFPIQASCLCYHTRGKDTTATWAPSVYDGLMSSCNDYAQTQQQASTITSIGNSSNAFNLCSSAGDVRATPALAAASSTTTTSASPAAKTTTASTPTATATLSSADRMSILNPLILCIGAWFFRLVM